MKESAVDNAEKHDLVIRNARIVDGSGRATFNGDVAVRDGLLSQVGGKASPGRREIDADGLLLTPGFVDIHTHYDGQINWDPQLTPSTWHGVTTVVAGNCGVGFAPARPQAREWLIGMMEGIEDIPGDSLRAGIDWKWETFPEFMDVIGQGRYAVDVGLQIPHGALRAFVMGDRGIENVVANAGELDAMCRVVQEGMRAGALGLTGTRSINHRSLAGKNAPGYGIPYDELVALASAAASVGHGGVIGVNVDFDNVDDEVRDLRRLARECGLKVWTLLNQFPQAPDKWKHILDAYSQAAKAGEALYAQVAGRPISYLLGLTSSRNPFWENPSYRAIAALPLAQRVARLKDPAFRRQLLTEQVHYSSVLGQMVAENFDRMFKMGSVPDYEPTPEQSIAAMAKREGRDAREIALDMMLERDGNELIYMPLSNYVSGDASLVKHMLEHPQVVLGLGDAGAHASRICDSSISTFMLTHWARDRTRGPRMALEQAVHLQTQATAAFYGLHDRGVLEAGKRADINLIDLENLTLFAPEVVRDQPANAQRLVQHTKGYVATIVAGVPVMENGVATGELPGRLIRSRARD